MGKANSRRFIETAILNDLTYIEIMSRLKRLATSIFEWVNLPDSMDSRFLELTLFEKGQACLLYDEMLGFLNTSVSGGQYLNVYDLPTELNCYANSYTTTKKTYNGLIDVPLEEASNYGIFVMNNFDRTPTRMHLELFAYRLYEVEQAMFTNVVNQKYPLLILMNDKQRLTMQNLYNQYNGNYPVIFGDKNNLDLNDIKVLNTNSPYVVDKLSFYKKEIWNELLTYLGVNNIDIQKKERLIQGESNANNELINYNLQASLYPRKLACKQFNKLFKLEGTDKAIDVKLRSDIDNVIKEVDSTITQIQNEAMLDGIITPDEQMVLDMLVDNKNIDTMDKAIQHQLMNPFNNPDNMDMGVKRNLTLEEKKKETPKRNNTNLPRKRGRKKKSEVK